MNVGIKDSLVADAMRDTLTSKAQEIYESLNIKRTSNTEDTKHNTEIANTTNGLPVSSIVTDDDGVMLATAPAEGSQLANLDQALDLDGSFGVTDRVCNKWYASYLLNR